MVRRALFCRTLCWSSMKVWRPLYCASCSFLSCAPPRNGSSSVTSQRRNAANQGRHRTQVSYCDIPLPLLSGPFFPNPSLSPASPSAAQDRNLSVISFFSMGNLTRRLASSQIFAVVSPNVAVLRTIFQPRPRLFFPLRRRDIYDHALIPGRVGRRQVFAFAVLRHHPLAAPGPSHAARRSSPSLNLLPPPAS